MSPQLTFVLMMAPALLAAITALVAEMIGRLHLGGRAAIGLLFVGAAAGLYGGWTVDIDVAYGSLRAGGVFSTLPAIVLAGAAVTLLASNASRRTGVTTALVSLAAVGASIAFVGADLVTLLIGLETVALCGYALVAISRDSRSTEASLKYFVQGAVATGLFVLGTAVLVGLYAPDGFYSSIVAALGGFVPETRAVSFGFLAIVVAVAFKAGAAPFHSWAPDAYETADSGSAAFLAGAAKLGMIGVLASLLTALLPAGVSASRRFGILGADAFVALGALAVLSIVIGSTVALRTRSYKRMLAYAGIAQVGYALIALGALNPSGALVFAATYATATTAAFLAAEVFVQLRPEWDGTVEGLAGLGRQSPLLGVSLTVALMSLAGIPPLLGFWGKLQAFAAGVAASVGLQAQGDVALAAWMVFLVAAGLIGSVVSLGYYGAVIRVLFSAGDPQHEAATEKGDETGASPTSLRIVIALAVLVVLLGLAPIVFGISASVSGFMLVG